MAEGTKRLLEAGERRARHAGADLADARAAVRDAGVDRRRDAGLDHETRIDTDRRAGEFEGRDLPLWMAPERDLAHPARGRYRVGEAAGANEPGDRGRSGHREGPQADRLEDRGIANVRVR